MQTLRKRRKKRRKKSKVIKPQVGSEEFREKMREVGAKMENNPLVKIARFRQHSNMDPEMKKARDERKSKMQKKVYDLNPRQINPCKKKKLHKRINTYSGVITDKEYAEL